MEELKGVVGWQAHLISQLAYNNSVIVNENSNTLLASDKSH